jgi:geranylgeranyl diphosphate synthase, type II
MTAAAEPVEATLANYASLTGEAMDRYLRAAEPSTYLYELVGEYPRRGGKRLRPALLLATCLAYGGSIRDGLDVAVAVEMLHNAFLIHDDLQDGSERRRGHPTLHAMHGVPLAVNAGDALATLALRPLQAPGALGSRVARQVLDEVIAMILKTTEGQALELGWRRDNVVDLGPDDYLELVAKKTCWYTTVAPLRLGALIGSRGMAFLGPLSRFGFCLGAAFQIRDDLLSLADDGRHGKDALGDLREGKRTLMLIHLLADASPADREWLVDFLGRTEAEGGARDVGRVRRLMTRHGSLEFADDYANGLAEAAVEAFDEAFADVRPSAHLDFIRNLAPYVVSRHR